MLARRYSLLLAKILSGVTGESGARLFHDAEQSAEAEVVRGVSVHSGVPGAAAGHAVTSASYFDRKWEATGQSDRFYLTLTT